MLEIMNMLMGRVDDETDSDVDTQDYPQTFQNVLSTPPQDAPVLKRRGLNMSCSPYAHCLKTDTQP